MRNNNKSILLTLVLGLLLTFTACDDSDVPSEPEENPGEALLAQSIVIKGQMNSQLNDIRVAMNVFWGGNSPSEELADGMLKKITNNNHLIWSSGLINHEGIVSKVFPASEDSLIGKDWSGKEAIEAVFATTSFASEKIEETSLSFGSMRYFRTVPDEDQPYGAMFCSILVDTLISNSITFVEFDEENQRGFFVLEDDATIVHDRGNINFGDRLNDAEIFTQETVTIAQDMIDRIGGDGYVLTSSTDLPGATYPANKHYVSWSIVPLVDSHFFVIALTEPSN